MNVTIFLPLGWPPHPVFNDNDLEQPEFQAEGSTMEEALKDAARQNEHLRLIIDVVCDKTRRHNAYIYLGRTEYRNLPLRLETPIEEGDIISLKCGG